MGLVARDMTVEHGRTGWAKAGSTRTQGTTQPTGTATITAVKRAEVLEVPAEAGRALGFDTAVIPGEPVDELGRRVDRPLVAAVRELPLELGTFGPARSQRAIVRSLREVVDMRNDKVLAETVRAWVAQDLPDVPELAAGAAEVARASYSGGAPVSEACRQAHAYVGCWLRHPANQRIDADVVGLAS